MVQQIRRSSATIAANIVEGHKRKSTKDFLNFLNIADSSLEETKYHLLLSRDLNYIDKNSYENIVSICNEIGKLLYGLQKALREKLKLISF